MLNTTEKVEPRQPYAKPQLTTHGDAKKLTQSPPVPQANGVPSGLPD